MCLNQTVANLLLRVIMLESLCSVGVPVVMCYSAEPVVEFKYETYVPMNIRGKSLHGSSRT